jgi:transcription antitermination factor NusG
MPRNGGLIIGNLKNHKKKEWFVIHTWTKAEKAVSDELRNRGYEVFLPLTRKLSIWKNRQKKHIENVLFPGYLFVKTESFELFKIVRVPKVVGIVNCGGEPSIVPHPIFTAMRMRKMGNSFIGKNLKLYIIIW